MRSSSTRITLRTASSRWKESGELGEAGMARLEHVAVARKRRGRREEHVLRLDRRLLPRAE
jgi:hypothetical protein